VANFEERLAQVESDLRLHAAQGGLQMFFLGRIFASNFQQFPSEEYAKVVDKMLQLYGDQMKDSVRAVCNKMQTALRPGTESPEIPRFRIAQMAMIEAVIEQNRKHLLAAHVFVPPPEAA
jgi:hypothetical protein